MGIKKLATYYNVRVYAINVKGTIGPSNWNSTYNVVAENVRSALPVAIDYALKEHKGSTDVTVAASPERVHLGLIIDEGLLEKISNQD